MDQRELPLVRCDPNRKAAWDLRRILLRLARSPQTISRLLIDRYIAPVWLRGLGVRMGTGCSFVGFPIVTLTSGGSITLGKDVKVFSRFDSNPAGLPHPAILVVLAADSTITIGDRTGLSGPSIVARAGVTIGRNVLIGAGACLWDTDFHPLDPQRRREHQTRDASCAPIRIEDDVFVGARAFILKGVRVGRGAVIGAGAVVTKDVAPYDVVAGNPAKVVGSIPVKSQENAIWNQ